MPLCSRRAWKTPSGFTTWPTPGCYDDSVVLPRFQSRYSDRKTAGVYHDNHPHTAADAALRGLLLSRLNRVRWPTFIPALTTVHPARRRGRWNWHRTKDPSWLRAKEQTHPLRAHLLAQRASSSLRSTRRSASLQVGASSATSRSG